LAIIDIAIDIMCLFLCKTILCVEVATISLYVIAIVVVILLANDCNPDLTLTAPQDPECVPVSRPSFLAAHV
jgi:hypothetical protein